MSDRYCKTCGTMLSHREREECLTCEAGRSFAPATGSAKRDGNWMDECGACKVCDGEIPYGHSGNCDIYRLERKVAELTSLLEATRRYRIGHEVPMDWFIKRDEAIGNPAVTTTPPNNDSAT